MPFLQIIYIYIISVNDFSALSHTHNFNTVNFYKSVIDFGVPEKTANFAFQTTDFVSNGGFRFRSHEKSLRIARKIASDRTKISFRIVDFASYSMKIDSDSGLHFRSHENSLPIADFASDRKMRFI